MSPSETVLVLTDGSAHAKRVAEWNLVFVGVPGTAVRRIDVLDCLDSGVVIQTNHGDSQDERERPGEYSRSTRATNQHQQGESTIDALHGVPHEALLDYVTTNPIDGMIMSTHERTHPNRSFLGHTFARVYRAAPVPVITTTETATAHISQCKPTPAAREYECVFKPGQRFA